MKTEKYKAEDVINQCKSLGYTFISINNEKDNKGHNKRVVIYVCNKHTNRGRQSKEVYKFMSCKKPCSYCNHSYLKYTFNEEMMEINPQIEILSKYKNWNTKIKCRCKIHNNEWYAAVSTLLYGGGCPICGKIKASQNERNKHDDVVNRIKQYNPNIDIIEMYTTERTPIKCKCNIDGHEWYGMPITLMNGTAGCPICTSRKLNEKFSLSQEEFVKNVQDKNKNIVVLGKYHNMNTKVLMKCLVHNIEFEGNPRNLMYKGGNACPKCYKSSGEKILERILDEYGFNYTTQKTFDDCKNLSKLRFDAYDIDNNIVYEYQGGQHYFPVDFAGKGESWAEEQFSINQLRDKIKRKYCEDNRITLIEIPYWHTDDMESFLLDKWNNV